MSEVTVDFAAIPSELKQRDQWLLWDASADTPRRPHWRGDFGVSWNDPDDWHSFEEARRAVEEVDSWGLGYVFAKDNEDYLPGLYSGLDLDGCVVDKERERPVEWLPDLSPLVEHDAYLEFSPSNDGVHIPLIGIEIPDWWKNVHKTADEHEGVEAYGSKFFTFTGDTLSISGSDVGQVPQEVVNEWLAEAYENLTGEDPRETHTPASESESVSRSPNKSREELEDVETTDDIEDVLDAVDHLQPSDLRLQSSYQEDENADFESWDPGYRTSQSGKSLKRIKKTNTFFDMAEGDVHNLSMFGPLDILAAESSETSIGMPWETVEGEDWWTALEIAREHGAPIPKYTGSVDGDLPDDDVDETVELTDEMIWDIWSQARADGRLDEESRISSQALRHVAKEQDLYDFDALPDGVDTLPAKAHNRALGWVEHTWADSVGIGEEEDATSRRYVEIDEEAVFTWEDVRYVYDKVGKEDGRHAAVTLLRKKYRFLTPQDTEDLHVYDEELGIFDRTAKHLIGRELDRNLGSNYSQHEKREIIGRLKEQKVEREELEARRCDGEYICVKNGVLDVDEQELLPHDPKYKFTTYLPVEYDPEAVPENILRFLRDITKRDADARTLLEVLGHTLLSEHDAEWKHLFLVLFGEGSNGKSTWFDIVRKFLNGEQNQTRHVESLTLQQITDNRFAASSLVGKWANLGEDLPQKKIANLGKLKDLTGGGETWVERKGEEGFNFRNRATMMFAANRPPVLGERTTAVKRRLVPVHLPYEYKQNPDPSDPYQKKAEPSLVEELTTDEELSGLLNAALAGLERMREQEDVSLPESRDERLELYERHSDHIKAFRVDCLTNEKGRQLSKDDIYNAYTNFCNQNDYTKVAASTFWRQLRQTTLNVTEKRLAEQADGSRPRVLQDVTFKEEGLAYAPESFKRESETDVDESQGTPISTLSPGDVADGVTVEVVQQYVDEKKWFKMEGWVADESGPAKLVVRDELDYIFEVGKAYRLDRVSVTTDDGIVALEPIPNMTAVEEISLGEGTTVESGIDWMEQDSSTETTADSESDAVADGGGASASAPPENEGEGREEPTPDDLEGIKADARTVVTTLERVGGRVPRNALLSKVTMLQAVDMDLERAQKALDFAIERGWIMEKGDGLEAS